MSDKNLPGGKHTLVEEGTEFKGTLSSKCPIVVMGKVEGEISGPSIHITNTGVVAGSVKVKELHSAGEIAGEVEAEAVHISGRVRDKTVIRARSLEVSVNSQTGMEVVFGECELAIGDSPNKEEAVAAALAPALATPPAAPRTETKNERPAVTGRRRGQSEASWDEAAAATANAPKVEAATDDDAGGKRRRGTQPPPLPGT
jgi:cytoskeletal protein CcmA (bactofilin family)